MVTILLEQIIEILKGWLSSFTSWAEDVAEKLGLIEEQTEYIDDISDNTDSIAQNTLGIKSDTGGMRITLNNANARLAQIYSDTSTIKNNVGSISTNTGTTAAFSEDIATNTLNTLDKVTTIASDTTQMRSNTNNIYSDVDEIKMLLRYFSAGLIMEEDTEGDIATFDTDLTDYLVNCKCGFSTTKANNTLSGVSSINITRTGKNIITGSISGKNINSSGLIINDSSYNLIYAPVKQGQKYVITSDNNLWAFYTDIPAQNSQSYDSSRVLDSSKKFTAPITGYIAFRTTNGYSTPQLEFGETATDYEAPTGTTALINLGGTYYGGELDALNGRLKVTNDYIASYNGETINEPWISSLDDYVPNTLPTTGAEVVYPLITPYYVAVNNIAIRTLKGINNVYNDCDNTFVTYKESVKHYLDKQEG